ncbi:MAG: amidase [Actinomycetota bacterium]|nr:amidase [Actinomycetota bacterium]
MTVADLGRAYRDASLSPLEALASCRERITAVDPAVSAFTHLAFDEAESDAAGATQRAAKRVLRGPLDGIPVAVKELFEVHDWPHTGGSLALADRIGATDAVAVARLRSAGAVIVGLTRSHEFAWGITTQHAERGSTKNPWDLSRTPGGSSGGAAAAVAAQMVPVCLGSDTGGSVRIPAAFCGVVGVKPSYGSISVKGLVPLAPSLDHVGVLARTTVDVELVLAAVSVAGAVPAEAVNELPSATVPRESLEGLLIAVAPNIEPQTVPAYARALERARDALLARGADLRPTVLPDAGEVESAFRTIQPVEARIVHTSVLETYPARKDLYSADVAGRLEQAADLTLDDYVRASMARMEIIHAARSMFTGVDVVLSTVGACGPSRCSTPNEVNLNGEAIPVRQAVMPYTILQNVAGIPATTVPVGLDDDGLPIGVQVTGAAGTDAIVQRVARLLHENASFVSRPATNLKRREQVAIKE